MYVGYNSVVTFFFVSSSFITWFLDIKKRISPFTLRSLHNIVLNSFFYYLALLFCLTFFFYNMISMIIVISVLPFSPLIQLKPSNHPFCLVHLRSASIFKWSWRLIRFKSLLFYKKWTCFLKLRWAAYQKISLA